MYAVSQKDVLEKFTLLLMVDNGIITWSQSNYGGKLFEYVTANPFNYVPGLRFMGYLWHSGLKL